MGYICVLDTIEFFAPVKVAIFVELSYLNIVPNRSACNIAAIRRSLDIEESLPASGVKICRKIISAESNASG
jgi:hypothetical protein